MFIQVRRGDGRGAEAARGSHLAGVVNECEEVDECMWMRGDSGHCLPELHAACGGCWLLPVKSATHFSVQSRASELCVTRNTHKRTWILLLE